MSKNAKKNVAATVNATATNACDDYRKALFAALDKRIAYQSNKYSAASDVSKLENFKRTVKRYVQKLSASNVVETMFASNVDVDFLNTANFSNIYTAIKVAEFAKYISSNESNNDRMNHYTKKIFDTMLQFESRNLSFTRLDAKAAISVAVQTLEAKQSAVSTASNYAADTAQTQASSSIAMLRLFNVIRRDATSSTRDESFKINREAYASKLLLAKLAA